MTWVLVLGLWGGYSGAAPAMTSATFDSQKACESAGKDLVAALERFNELHAPNGEFVNAVFFRCESTDGR